MWTNLHYLSTSHDLPWLVAKDFNEISSPDEKNGGIPVSMNKCLNFTANFTKCNLIDLGFKCSPYTLSNKRLSNKHSLIRERLDRILCNEQWISVFPNSSVFHLYSPASDHMPLLLTSSTFLNQPPLLDLNLCGCMTIVFLEWLLNLRNFLMIISRI